MYSPACNYLPNRKQSSLAGSLPQNIDLLKNFTTKAFSNFDDSSINLDVDVKAKAKIQNQDTPGTSNIMDFVYSFGDSSRYKLKNSISNYPIERSKYNCKEIFGHYNSVSTGPVSLPFFYLVGGFVGSKSQLGRRQTHGLGVNMWDIIRDLVGLVGNSPSNIPIMKTSQKSSGEKKCNMWQTEEQNSQLNIRGKGDNRPTQKETGTSHKQSYAEVAKTKLSVVKENSSVKTIGQNGDQKNNRPNCSQDYTKPKSVIEPFKLCSNMCSQSRDRIGSECSADSEDSFIVFEYCEEDDYNHIDDSDSTSEEDEDILYCHVNKESHLKIDCVPSPTFSFNKSKEQPPGEKESRSQIDCVSSPTFTFKKSKEQPPGKKVRFAKGKNLVQVHPMVTWNYAYRTARRGPWEMLARDSERFKSRIANTEAILKPVLDPQHRENVFIERFARFAS